MNDFANQDEITIPALGKTMTVNDYRRHAEAINETMHAIPGVELPHEAFLALVRYAEREEIHDLGGAAMAVLNEALGNIESAREKNPHG